MLSSTKTVDEIRRDLKELSRFHVVVYGGYVKDKSIRDIDIAVITEIKDKNENLKIWYDFIGRFPKVYDIRIFEIMPLPLKMSVIDNYKVIYGDVFDISEYFYFYRKLWDDQKHRIEKNKFENHNEKIQAIKQWNKIKKNLSVFL